MLMNIPKKKRPGMSLLEILIVMAVIGVLFTMSLLSLKGDVNETARARELVSLLKNYRSAFFVFDSDTLFTASGATWPPPGKLENVQLSLDEYLSGAGNSISADMQLRFGDFSVNIIPNTMTSTGRTLIGIVWPTSNQLLSKAEFSDALSTVPSDEPLLNDNGLPIAFGTDTGVLYIVLE